MNVKEKLDKIKKMLAKADKAKNNSEAEAEVAMKMAMKMMEDSGISMTEVQSSSMDDELGELGNTWLNNGEAKRMLNWKKILLSSLCYFFDCRVVSESVGSGKLKYNIIGRESNRITCEMFFNWIHDRTMKEARELYHAQTTKRNAYCLGVARGISSNIFKMKPKNDTKNGWGIVPINETDAYMKKLYPSLVKGKKIETSIRDASAYNAGKETGTKTSLNHQFGLKAIA